jgi:hypothetical protein
VKWRLAIILAAAAALVAPLPAAVVERFYAQPVFPAIQRTLTNLSNSTQLAWLDLLIAAAALWVITVSVSDFRRGTRTGAAVRVLFRLATVASIAYLVFLATWGLNYRRQPVSGRVHYDAARVSPAAAVTLAEDAVAQLNALYAAAHAQGWSEPTEIDTSLAHAFNAAARRLGLPGNTIAGRPKRSVLDLYFRRTGVAGMTDPIFLETLVASDVLPFERPSVVAHEWGHLAGLTDEGEASLLGWLTCVSGPAAQQYSGWLSLYPDVINGLPREAAGRVSAQLAGGPRADLDATRQRSSREVSPRLSRAGWQVYDRYLKANRVEAGTASYEEVVRLILGTGLR